MSSHDSDEDNDDGVPYVAQFDPASLNTPTYDEIAKMIADADAVLIGAGAGMSVSAGLDYNDKKTFAALWPEGDRVAWAYRIASVNWILNLPKHPVYGELLELVQNKDHFVISSNVDMFFEKNGFDPKRIWEPQGDWRTMQCLTPCRPDAYWPSQPTIDAILPQIDYENFVVPASAVPRCPHCGGKVSFNLRGGDWYIESTYHAPGEQRFDAWLNSDTVRNGKLLVFDIGSGFNTPTVVRLRVERVALQHGNSDFVRVNKFNPELHSREHGEHGYSLPVFADEFVDGVYAARAKR